MAPRLGCWRSVLKLRPYPFAPLATHALKRVHGPRTGRGWGGVGGEWNPVFKKGDRQVQKNFRPVTVLSCLNKAFERLLSYCLSQTPSLALWSTENVPRTTSYLSVSSQRTCRKLLILCIHHSCYPRQGGRHASELLVRSPKSCTNRDGRNLLEASKSWLSSGVSLRTASL